MPESVMSVHTSLNVTALEKIIMSNLMATLKAHFKQNISHKNFIWSLYDSQMLVGHVY